MINYELYPFMDNIDKTQIIDESIELQTILDCGGVLMIDSKNPVDKEVFVLYIDTGRLKISKVKTN